MMHRTHVIAGASWWVTASALNGPPRWLPLIAGAACAAGGAMIPDTDRHRLVAKLTGGHRHATHSLVGLAFTFAVTAIVPAELGRQLGWLPLAVTAGYASHLAADAMTVRGIPVFWPDLDKYWLLPRRLRVATGGKRRSKPRWWQARRRLPWGEWLVLFLTIAVTAACCYWRWH
jgi:membrane-bound metal-dependent hydrolase YbcI (DUF457 family)